MDNYSIALLGMACITFSCRYLFFSKKVTFELGPRTKKLLSYTAPSVMTAMWVPIVFLGHQSSGGEFMTSPFLIAGLVSVVLSLKIKNTLVVVGLGMMIFVGLKVFL
jgi:branched-subunit amino acid transport protein